ncbi:hypothetical protein N6L24_12330 [Cognatishimia sp. SS12]|uniref:hypothetical protein n=1 Tax=Cognatishimia sp. SS12 TaxID=2979465 RepID=UPI00232B29D0|nr:hypothetical protein [Cognatishimia sp. SS12]MDC0739068.1 hypothetical protein [Cognatishimia sp. SS12]
MKLIGPILALVLLAGCGVDGAPIRPSANLGINIGPGGISPSARVGASQGPVSVGVSL